MDICRHNVVIICKLKLPTYSAPVSSCIVYSHISVYFIGDSFREQHPPSPQSLPPLHTTVSLHLQLVFFAKMILDWTHTVIVGYRGRPRATGPGRGRGHGAQDSRRVQYNVNRQLSPYLSTSSREKTRSILGV